MKYKDSKSAFVRRGILIVAGAATISVFSCAGITEGGYGVVGKDSPAR